MKQADLLKALVEMMQKQATSQAKKSTPKASDKMTKEEFEVALIEACKKAGYASPEPRFNILTYDLWLAKGRKVRKGEHGIKVKGRKTRLFHEAQTEPVVQAVQPVADMTAQQATA